MNKDLRFCLVGRGSIGTRHLKNLRLLSYKNIIAYSEYENSTKDKDYEHRFGIKTLHDLDSIKEYKPDAFIIANPSSEHVKIAEIATEINSHIFMEKPFSNDLSGTDALSILVAKKKLRFFLANNFRFHPALIKIKELLESNDLGHIYFANIMAGQYLPDWHPGEDYRGSYSAKKNLGGGVVLTLQHEIDYSYWLFGKFKRIKSFVRKISNLDIDVEDIASIIIETESGSLIEIHLDYLQRPPKRTIQIQGSKGSVDFRFGDRDLKLYAFEKQEYKNILDLDNYNTNQMYIDELEYFIESIDNRNMNMNNIEDAIYVLNACLDIKKEYI